MKKLLSRLLVCFTFFFLAGNVSAVTNSANITGSTSLRANYTTTLNIVATATNRIRGAEFNLSSNNSNIEIVSVSGANGFTVSGSNGKYLVYKLESGFSVASGTVIATVKVKVKSGSTVGSKGTITLSDFKMTLADSTDTVSGSGDTHTITVASEPVLSSVNTLSTLTSSVASIAFDKNTTSYNVSVGNDVTSLGLVAKATSSSATVSISGDENFKTGTNMVTVLVTAENGSKKTYTITVTKAASDNNALASLTVSSSSFTFDPEVYEYNITITDPDVTSLDINYTAVDSTAIVEITGNEGFVEGSNVINITVTAENGEEVTYKINVTKTTTTKPSTDTNSEEDKNNWMVHIAWGIITAMLIAVIGIQWSISRKEDK
ncbi:MAG: cadherin-like beta sandwich domain-containing protein [Bacilli bacterium]|nr:cadherin-like beta sandwich domain-containing protein [Bacilli bacterium]